MATIPESDINLSSGVVFEDLPTNTFYVDPKTRRIRGMDAGLKAMRQAVEIALSVERFYWQIYSSNFGVDFSGIIGYDSGYVIAVLKDRIQSALSVDSRILGVSDLQYTVIPGGLSCEFTVQTVFGDLTQTAEVMTN